MKLLYSLLAAGTIIVAIPAHGATTRKTLYQAPQKSEASAESTIHRVKVNFVYDLHDEMEINGLFAIESSGAGNELYYGYRDDDSDPYFMFDLPAGTYDFFLGLVETNAQFAINLTKDGFIVDNDNLSFTLQASSATHRTDIEHIGPDGEFLTWKSSPDGTVPSANIMQTLTHCGRPIHMAGFTTDQEVLTYMLCNDVDSRFNTVRMDAMISPHGWLNMLIPIDFHKEVCSTGPTGWLSSETSFTRTPANDKIDSFRINNNEDPYYTFAAAIAVYDGKLLSTYGVGTTDDKCSSSKVAVWRPADYDGLIEMLPIPTGSCITGWSSSVSALPLRAGANGLEQVSINYLPYRATFATDIETGKISGNTEIYPTQPTNNPLGNCAPMLILTPDEELFDFGFKGRNGESMSQNSEYYVLPSIEYWEDVFGNPLCDVKLKFGDESLCTSRTEFPFDASWDNNGVYTLEISTDNVLVDGSIPGFCHTTHTFSVEDWIGMPPTLTSLRVLDANGEINDHLDNANGAKVSFTGGHFTYKDNFEQMFAYLDFSPIECVAVEYAPRGSTDFTPLEVAEVGEPILPGFGNLFEAKLNGVTRKSADNWYDLRITIKDEFEGTQTQTISPAFKLGQSTAISMPTQLPLNNMSLAEALNYLKANAISYKLYNLQGQQIATPGNHRGHIIIAGGQSYKFL